MRDVDEIDIRHAGRAEVLGLRRVAPQRAFEQERVLPGRDVAAAKRARDEASLRAAVKGADVVIHTAARMSDWGPTKDFWEDNVYGTQPEDAARRDFTINALYFDPATGEPLR